ncbi:hypothetical protein [Acrocarpospora sp. B8E8]|uniref:hypothetical protein n=1 Tax=Acrocarpospora sp. B8E8 TaxID=3153572 RepID=UPI00325F4F2B
MVDPWATNEPTSNTTPDPYGEDTTIDYGTDHTRDHVNDHGTGRTIGRSADVTGKIVTTIKFGAGYDAPWVVIHADSIGDSDAILSEQATRDYFAKVGKAAGYAKNLYGGSAGGGQRGGNAGGSGYGGGSRGNGGGGNGGYRGKKGKVEDRGGMYACDHGEAVYRSGNGKKGFWEGHFCPANPSQCDPAWL